MGTYGRQRNRTHGSRGPHPGIKKPVALNWCLQRANWREAAAPGGTKPRQIRICAEQKCQSAYKPGSVWRGFPRATAIHLGRPLPGASRNQPGRLVRKSTGVAPAPPLFGFAPGGVCHAVPVAGSAVGSYPTFSPLLRAHPQRFDLCGTFPGVAPAGRYPAPYLHGARTFLPRMTRKRPPGRLTGPVIRHMRRQVNENDDGSAKRSGANATHGTSNKEKPRPTGRGSQS
jgi:hypothetical protein